MQGGLRPGGGAAVTAEVCDLSGPQPGYDAPEPKRPGKPMGMRDWAMAGLELPVGMTWELGACRAVERLTACLLYGHYDGRMCSNRKMRTMDDTELQTLAERWVESLVAMSTAHDHEDRSRMDETTDELMRPLLTCPIAQVREFTRRVARMLEADARVPFLVWSSFKKLVEPLVLKSKDGSRVRLEELLAAEVAEIVVTRMEPAELVAAMAGALQWRSPESLKDVKAALTEQPEAKPRLRGRQSCLFLHVPKRDGSEAVVVL